MKITHIHKKALTKESCVKLVLLFLKAVARFLQGKRVIVNESGKRVKALNLDSHKTTSS